MQNVPPLSKQTGHFYTNITYRKLLRRLLQPSRLALLRQRLVGAQAGGVRVGGFRGKPQQIAAHGGQIQRQGVVPAKHTAVGGVEVLLAVRLVHAAPSAGLGVQHQLCAAGELEVQGELLYCRM